jgi:protein TonB
MAGRIDGQTQERPLPIDGFATQPQRTKTVIPSYPSNAQTGTVVLRAKIDPEGRVNAVSVVQEVTGGTDAAVKAVSQWEYTPTLLNGEPIWVVMTVKVPCPWNE